MHNKTEKFTTQLRQATHGERRNTALTLRPYCREPQDYRAPQDLAYSVNCDGSHRSCRCLR